MKAIMGIFFAGAFAAFLLDPTSGRDRRARVNGWVQPIGRRLRRTKEQLADSDTLANMREFTVPVVAQKVKDVATSVQEGVVSASSAVVRAGHAVGLGSDTPEESGASLNGTHGGTMSATAEARRAEVAPKAGLDPIPEGATNDPTLVSRVESELFRDGTVPKGRLNIDAANGVVTLRGTLDSDTLADDLVERTRAIKDVVTVVDLLHRK